MKNKSILLVIAILLIGLSLAGGTYAYLTMAVGVTNGNYTTNTTCFNIDYNISNEGSGQDITGTLFPSSGPSGGLSRRVGIKVNASCSTDGLGTLKLHINSGTSSSLMTAASSYCQDRKTLEAISGISTEVACDTAGGRWRGYGDSFCENPATLQRLDDDYSYGNQEDCEGDGYVWKSGGSPLKYAIYDNNDATGTILAKGYITSADINADKTIYTNFLIDSNQAYYYIFIWLDGYLVDNTVNDLPFSGYIKAEASQVVSSYVYTANVYDDFATNENQVIVGQTIPNTITQYSTPEAAMAALKTFGGGTTDYPFFLRHKLGNGIVFESSIGFVVTPTMAANNSGMTAGTYYLKAIATGKSEYFEGGDWICKSAYLNNNECISPYYSQNVNTLRSAFGTNSGYCEDGSDSFYCYLSSGFNTYTGKTGYVEVSYSYDDMSYCTAGGDVSSCWIIGD